LIVRYISGALVILFFTGLKDDILIIDPKKKLLSQLLAASFVVLLGDIRITGFHGILGLEDISYPLSIFVSVFLVVSLINGFNLIDGVDGLSSAIAIMGSAFFGTWFFLSGQVSWSVISFSIAGSLLAYFIFNVFGRTNKIFMGDTGSMITGLIVAIVTIKFINSEKFPLPFVSYKSVPAFAFSMLILPLFDTLRIIILRLIKGESPFKADKNHIHHNLLKLGLSHIQVTVFLVIITLTLVIPVIILKNVNSLITIGIVVLIAVVFTMLMDIAVKKTGRNIPGNS
jgi:UDP-N-acetylmuramyl pentapeptide phosphotransferase/UDP-N-acetylglucosamine-1-phosphate transferase